MIVNFGRCQYTIANLDGSRSCSDSKYFKILKYIIENGPKSKYDCITNVLGVIGTRKQLRGYYSVMFQSLRLNKLITLNYNNYTYCITDKGVDLVHRILEKELCSG